MGKILAILVTLAVIYLLFFKMKKKKTDDTKSISEFVECEKCGAFVEIKESVLSGGKYICKDCIKVK